MKIRPWKEIAQKLYEHSAYRKILDVAYELPDGQRKTFSLDCSFGRSVAVLPLTNDGHVVLARQFRPGPGKILDELPGGMVDEGESVEEAAARELLEETGHEADVLVSLGQLYDCAYSRDQRFGVLALGCKRRQGQDMDPTEFVEIVVRPLSDFIEQIKRGECTDLEVAWAGSLPQGS